MLALGHERGAEAVSIEEIDEAADEWSLTSYHATREAADDLSRLFVRLGIPPERTRIDVVADDDWVRRSLEGLAPVQAGRFFVHGSHDRSRRPPHGISVEIDAGLAFGTGHHATTRGCLVALERLLKGGRVEKVLDVGCGTGVLAIAAAKATRGRVLASDIDAEAVTVARRNARVNGVPSLRVVVADGLSGPLIASHAPFDLVFANILARPLVRLARPMSLRAGATAWLVLSGISGDQERWIEAAYRPFGFVVGLRHREAGWSTLMLHRP